MVVLKHRLNSLFRINLNSLEYNQTYKKTNTNKNQRHSIFRGLSEVDFQYNHAQNKIFDLVTEKVIPDKNLGIGIKEMRNSSKH